MLLVLRAVVDHEFCVERLYLQGLRLSIAAVTVVGYTATDCQWRQLIGWLMRGGRLSLSSKV